jgi:hypothetical protein
MKIMFAAAAFFLAVGAAAPAWSQAPGSPTASAAPELGDGELAALLDAHNYDAFGRAALSPHAPAYQQHLAGWLSRRAIENGGFYTVVVASIVNWQAAASTSDPRKQPGLLVDALGFHLYAYQIAMIDGDRCEDRSAPSARLNQLLVQRAAFMEALYRLDAAARAKIVASAIALERKTAATRTFEDYLCRGGMSEFSAALQGGQQKDLPNRPGTVGRTVGVAPPSNWAPVVLPASQIADKQAKARDQIAKTLASSIEEGAAKLAAKPKN